MTLEAKLRALVAELRGTVQDCLKESDRLADMQEDKRSLKFLDRGRGIETCADRIEALLTEVSLEPAAIPPVNQAGPQQGAMPPERSALAERQELPVNADDVILHAKRIENHWYVDVDKRLGQSGLANGRTLEEALTQAVGMALENRVFRRDRAGESLDLSTDVQLHCIGYPDCDGDLEGSHSEKCPLAAEPSSGTGERK